MSGDLLNRPRRRSSHGQMRTERVTQSMRSTGWNTCFPPGLSNVLAHDILRERQAIIQAEHPRPFQMPVVAQRRRQSRGHRDVSQPAALRCSHVSSPF